MIQPRPSADISWPRQAHELGLLHHGGDPHHCPACLALPEPPPNFVCPGEEANAEVLRNGPDSAKPHHTVDSITSDALDALYERLEAAEESESQRQLRGAREAFASATVRAAKAERAVNLLADSHRRAEKAEAAVARVRALHTDWLSTGAPPLGTSIARWWDKRLIELAAALDEPKEPTT